MRSYCGLLLPVRAGWHFCASQKNEYRKTITG